MAFFAACLFAVHPVHTDSVAYISGRRDILSTLFYLLGFYLFLLSRHKGKTGLLIAALVSYILAISSKEMAVTLPAVFFLYDCIHNLPDEGPLLKRCSVSLKRVISRHGFFYLCFLTVALLFTGYKVFIKSPSNKVGFYGGDLFVQILTVSKVLVHYIKLLFYPVNLLADYSFNSFPLSQSVFEPATFLSLLVLCALGFLAVKLLVINRLMAFAILWFFVTLLPVCHIFPHHELLAEHYLYLPSFGFVLLMALILDQSLTFVRWRYVLYTAFALVLVLFSVRTVNRNYDWKDSFSIWTKTVKTAPNCVRALNNLGIEYYKVKNNAQAEQYYQRAITLQPTYEKSFYNLGNIYREKEDYNRALSMYQKAAQLNPENFRNHNNLGNTYAMLKNFDAARKAFEKALECKPDYAEAHNNLGNIYRSQGNIDKAITSYQSAVRLKPFYEDAYTNLVSIYVYLNQYEKAIQLLEQARSDNPFVPFVHKNLGIVYNQMKQYDKAVIMYERALILEPASSEIHINLGKLHAQRNRHQQAIDHFQKALDSKPSSPEPHLNLADIYLKQLNDKQKALYHLRAWLAQAPEDKRAAKIRKTIEQIERGGEKRTSNIERPTSNVE